MSLALHRRERIMALNGFLQALSPSNYTFSYSTVRGQSAGADRGGRALACRGLRDRAVFSRLDGQQHARVFSDECHDCSELDLETLGEEAWLRDQGEEQPADVGDDRGPNLR